MIIANVGMDFSKPWFDVCVVIEDREHERKFKNSPKGCLECFEWLESFDAARFNVVFEPTARYSDLVVEFLFKQRKFSLFQAQPKKFSDYKKSLDFRTKTDSVDAWALSVYALERAERIGKGGLQRYEPKTPLQRELRDIRLRLRSLYKRRGALLCQKECGLYSERIANDIQAELAYIEANINAVLDIAKEVIAEDAQMSRDVELLDSIVGIGWKTALALVCIVDFRKFKSADDLVCFLGLSNRRRRSGISIKGKDRISKAGDKTVRAALYWPAMSAINANPPLRAFALKLQARGKIHPVVRTAVARKLVAIAWSVIKNQKPFDPEYRQVA